MLRLSKSLFNQPVMGLHSGGQIAVAVGPIINPHNLRILGWWCKPRGNGKDLILLVEDVRQQAVDALVVNSDDVLSEPDDLVRHKEILNIRFELLNKPVKTKRQKLGRVTDFSYNDGMFVQKLYVSVPLTRVLAKVDTLLIDRTQIVEVTDQYILVRDTEVSEGAEELATAAAV